MESTPNILKYQVSMTLDPKVMQWFTGRGNGNFILSAYFSTLNYPPDAHATARCSMFATNQGGGITTSKRFPGANAVGNFSSAITFVAEAQESSCVFGSILPTTSSISFALKTTVPADQQTMFMVCVGLDAFGPHRVPTTDEVANSLLKVVNGEASAYQGVGTLFKCPLPVTGFQCSVQNVK